MIEKHNIPLNQISWLNLPNVDMGTADFVYYPENIEELICICKNIYADGRNLHIFGHTSNCYFKSTFVTENVIITSKLNKYSINNHEVICECGAPIKKIARDMVEIGAIGYSGLCDLPGTVGGAVFGNAGCFDCEMSTLVNKVEVLTPSGSIITYSKDDIGFARRNSNFKKKVIAGIILRVFLKKEFGDAKKIKSHAELSHNLRLKTQPGPNNNLGSCFMSGYRRFAYKIIQRISRYLCKLSSSNARQLDIELKILGYSYLSKYLFDMNRFIWKDADAVNAFDEYVALYRKLYKDANLEIMIYK